jgi:hypothetical protein
MRERLRPAVLPELKFVKRKTARDVTSKMIVDDFIGVIVRGIKHTKE